MTWLNEMGVDPIWAAAGVFLAVHCLALCLASIAQRRNLVRRLQLLEEGFHRAQAQERSNLEHRLRELGEHQKESLEALRNGLAESRLRSHPGGLGPLEAAPGTRLEKKHRVVSLAQMGFDSRDISRKLRLSRGETELLLGLSEHFASPENGHDRDSL